jgi:hypothetical protein
VATVLNVTGWQAGHGVPSVPASRDKEEPAAAVDAVLGAYREEGRRLASVARGAELVERALRGEPV